MLLFRHKPPLCFIASPFLITSLGAACDETPAPRGDAPVLLEDAGYYDGKTWTEETLAGTSRLNAIWDKDADEIYAVGHHDKDRSVVLRYDGMTWSRLRSDVAGSLGAAWGDETGHIFVGGEGGSLLHRWLENEADDAPSPKWARYRRVTGSRGILRR